MPTQDDKGWRRHLESLKRVLPLHSNKTINPSEVAEELQINRIELELQCENLKDALLDAEHNRDVYRQVYEFGPFPYLMTDKVGHIEQMNLAARSILGLDHKPDCSAHRSFQTYITADDLDRFHLFMRQALTAKQWSACQIKLIRKHAIPIDTIVQAVPLQNGQGLLLALIDISERVGNQQRLAQSESGLAHETEKALELQLLCAALIRASRPEELYNQIVYAAATVMQSQGASMQILDSDGNLKLLAWKGFHASSAAYWKTIHPTSTTSCGTALATGVRVTVPDVEDWELVRGTRDLEEFRRSHFRAFQSTPLISPTGTLVGMVSTHWSVPHTPSSSDLRYFDVLARLAADLIVQKRFDQQLREKEAWLSGQKEAFQAAMIGAPLQASLGALVRTAIDHFGGDARASFYVVNPDAATLSHIVGMPKEYAQSTENFKVGADSLACGLAAHVSDAVITQDVMLDPQWEPWHWLALKYGFRACWSFPVRTTSGPVLGTFTLYFREPRQPTVRDLELAGIITHAATIIMSRNQEIVERCRAEQGLRELANHLEKRVEERTTELVESQDRLRALAVELNLAEQRERKRLAAELHDHLQQTLVLGKLTVGQAKRSAVDIPPTGTVLKKLDGLLGDALSYTRTLVADLSPPVLRDHGLVAGLKWLAESMKKHDLTVTVDVPKHSLLRPSDDQTILLFQSVRELLINASKYAGTGEATVRMSEHESRLEITVRDNGIGFNLGGADSTEMVHGPEISSKFGLFSVRERMHAIGGTFSIESQEGKGTLATLVLPIHEMKEAVRNVPVNILPPASPHTMQGQPHQETTSIRVLLVDDHAMVRQGLRAILDSYHDVEIVGEASDGIGALAAVSQVHPHVVVMDINMPKMNGIDAATKIKAQYSDIAIIGLSVNTEADNQDAMRKAGASMLLTKEGAVEELYLSIQRVMKPTHRSSH